jgi:hypothetical protein
MDRRPGDEDRDDDGNGDDFGGDPAAPDRAAAFMARHGGDTPLSTPLLVGGLLALAWWALLGWQAVRWWPQADGSLQVAVGVGSVLRDADGAPTGLRVGEGAGALHFDCARRGRWQWQVLQVPVVECHQAGVFVAAHGRQVHVRYDRPQAGGFRRMLALTAGGRPLWSLDDSIEAFGWLLYRGAFAGVLLLIPGWLLHRWRRA